MKKNLLTSIALLLVAAFTLCGVTFAYFSGSDTGGDQNVTLTEFKFTRADKILNTDVILLKPPTKINFPKIEEPVAPVKPNRDAYNSEAEYMAAVQAYLLVEQEYLKAYSTYLSDGDDKYFNDVSVAVKITISNLSKFDIEFFAEVEAVNADSSLTDFSSALRFFMFSPENSAILTDDSIDNELYGDYAKMLYQLTAAVDTSATLPDGSVLPVNPTLRQVNEFKLKAAQLNEQNTLPRVEKYDGVAAKSVDAVIMYWLDYDSYVSLLPDKNVSAYLKGKLNLNIAVTAMNITD